MKLLALVLVVAACGKSDSKHEPSLDELAARCDQIAADEQPTLDALVSRVTKLKGNIGNNPGWEAQFRYAQMANDELGLPPFEQLATPPGRSLPPASLLGMRPYVHQQCPKLAKQGDRHALEFMLQDLRRRYDEGVAHVDGLLKPIEAWVASQHGSGAAGSAQ